MKFIILVGFISKKIFGVQFVIGNYVFQFAYWKFGVFNTKKYKWWPK